MLILSSWLSFAVVVVVVVVLGVVVVAVDLIAVVVALLADVDDKIVGTDVNCCWAPAL